MNFKLLHLFHKYGSPLHIDLIQSVSGVPRSTLYRQIKSLTEAGLLEAVGKGTYAPGWLTDEISRIKNHSFDNIVEIAKPIMQEINEEIGESVNLTVVRGSKVKVLAHLESTHNLKYSYVEGQILDIFKGASSKILLAHLPEEHQRFLIESDITGASRKTLQEELIQIKADGYAVTASEVDENAIGISAPILRSGKYIIGGLSIAGPIFRIKDDKINIYIERLKEAALDISLMLEDS